MSVDLKVVILGKSDVGKTCLLHRFINGIFDETQRTTISAAFLTRKFTTSTGKEFVMGVWDTAGSEKYESVSKVYYRNAKVAIVCYDLSSAVTFGKVNFWINELKQNEPDCEVIICGNKLDLVEGPDKTKDRSVDMDDVKDYAKRIGVNTANIFETSAKTGEGVEEVFKYASTFFEKVPGSTNEPTGDVNLNENKKPNKKGCC